MRGRRFERYQGVRAWTDWYMRIYGDKACFVSEALLEVKVQIKISASRFFKFHVFKRGN